MMVTLHSPRDLTVREMVEGEEFSAWLADLTAADPGAAEERHLVLSDEIGDWVGGLRYVLRWGVAHVLDVGVVPAERHQGHGLRLLQAFEDHARDRGAHLLEFWTDRDQVGPLIDRLLENLRTISEKVNEGEGSPARLINDETLARAIEDVVIGFNDSKFLRWLIQNRRKKGEAVRGDAEGGPPSPPPVAEPSTRP